LATLLAAALVLAAVPVSAEGREDAQIKPTQTLLGSYLAGRLARSTNDTETAVKFYREALNLDPDNPLILEQSFLMEASEGNADRADTLARRVLQIQPTYRLALTWLACGMFKAGKYEEADTRLRGASGGPIGELTTTLARAWVLLAQGDQRAALAVLDASRLPESAQYYVRYHRALLADLAGRRTEARQAYERVFKVDQRTPRLAIAYARHAANSGDMRLARSILAEHLQKTGGEGHPLVRDLMNQLNGNQIIPLLVESPEQGLTEVFYGLGEALAGEGSTVLGTIYLQMALLLRPSSPYALAAIANVYETTNRYQRAIDAYERIPAGTPMQSAIEIRKAMNLNQLDRVDEAKVALEVQARANPQDVRPLLALGDMMRARKRYAEAVEYFTRVIDLVPKPDAGHWIHWYSRGTSYERIKKWPQAEADLQRALQLSPDQPLVLNYLGYTWIDQNRNLKQGLAMIEKAVAKKPDDGYIVDSLGWAHYRLGNFKEAVRHLERAVELKPEDPTLNDHLGDAYWRVGRHREARFQWDLALGLKPEPEEVQKIIRKLQRGLPAEPIAKSAPKKTKGTEAARTEGARRRAETQLQQRQPFQ
jgi:Flp pilus assembly protein TadD